MQIDDLTAGLSLSFIIHLNNEELQFESRILEVYSRRNTLLAEGVITEDKNNSFRRKGQLVAMPEAKPTTADKVSAAMWELKEPFNVV